MILSTISRLGFLSHQLDLTGRELMEIQPFQREPAALTYVDIISIFIKSFYCHIFFLLTCTYFRLKQHHPVGCSAVHTLFCSKTSARQQLDLHAL